MQHHVERMRRIHKLCADLDQALTKSTQLRDRLKAVEDEVRAWSNEIDAEDRRDVARRERKRPTRQHRG